MIKRILTLAVLVLSLAVTGCSVEKVTAGTVGVRVHLTGDDKGVQNNVVGPGWYFLTFNEEIYPFPTFTQNYTWDGPQAFSFQTKEGLNVGTAMGIAYHIQPDKVSTVFQRYRKGVDEITGVVLHNIVRDALVKEASRMNIEDVYGTGRSDLLTRVENDAKKQVEDIGIVVERLSWVGGFNLPESVVQSVNNKINAVQISQQRENEVAQAKAEADKLRAQAQGEADAAVMRAKAEAEAIRIRGEALQQNPALVQLQAVEKWNGVLPVTMMGGQTIPFVAVPNGK